MSVHFATPHQQAITEVLRESHQTLMAEGVLPTTCKVWCGGGDITLQADFDDDEHKKSFVLSVLALTVRHRANMVTMVSEAWQAPGDWSGRPSESPDRQESLLIVVEDHRGRSQTVLIMQRDDDGDLFGLDLDSSTYHPGEIGRGGRFARLLAPRETQDHPPARAAAEMFLNDLFGAAPGSPLPGLGAPLSGRA